MLMLLRLEGGIFLFFSETFNGPWSESESSSYFGGAGQINVTGPGPFHESRHCHAEHHKRASLAVSLRP